MAAFYADRVRKGKMKLAEVPPKWYSQTAAMLAADGQ